MSNNTQTNFIYDILIQIGDVLISTEAIDIDVSIKEAEEDGRTCKVRIYNLNEKTTALFYNYTGRVKVSVAYNTVELVEDYYNGTIHYAFDYRQGNDMVLECLLQDGIVDAINSPVSTSATQGSTKLKVVQDMLNGGKIELGQYPESLKTTHSSSGSTFIQGDAKTEVQRYLGRKYIVSYKDNKMNIYERTRSLIGNNIISASLLYDYPKRQMSADSQDRSKITKEYEIQVLPRPTFTLGTQVKIVGSKYIDEKFYTIKNVSTTLSKNAIYCQMSLIEGSLSDA